MVRCQAQHRGKGLYRFVAAISTREQHAEIGHGGNASRVQPHCRSVLAFSCARVAASVHRDAQHIVHIRIIWIGNQQTASNRLCLFKAA